MSFFDDAGAWFDQAGKDIGEAVQDAGEWFHETQDTIVNDVVFGDVADTIIGVQDDINQGIYNILHPNNPAAGSVVDQIENQRPDYVAEPDFGGPVPVLPSPIDGPDFGAPVDALPTPDPGPDFGAPVDALPSPEFKAFDPLTNPAPALGGDDFQPHDFAYQNHFGSDSAFVTSTFDFDSKGMEELQMFVGDAGGALSSEINDLNDLLANAMVEIQAF